MINKCVLKVFTLSNRLYIKVHVFVGYLPGHSLSHCSLLLPAKYIISMCLTYLTLMLFAAGIRHLNTAARLLIGRIVYFG